MCTSCCIYNITYCFLHLKVSTFKSKHAELKSNMLVKPVTHDILSRCPAYIACVKQAVTNPGCLEQGGMVDSCITT